MIVEADSLPWGLTTAVGSEGRLLGAEAIVQTSVNQGIVLELEGPEDAPRMYPTDIAMEQKKPEAVPAYAEVPPADQVDVPPPPVTETGKSRSIAEFRPGTDASNSSAPRPIRNVRWDDEAEPSARRGSAGLPLSLAGGIAGVGLVALLAWSRLRRRAAA